MTAASGADTFGPTGGFHSGPATNSTNAPASGADRQLPAVHYEPSTEPREGLFAAARQWIRNHSSQPDGDRWRDDPKHLDWAAENLLCDLEPWLVKDAPDPATGADQPTLRDQLAEALRGRYGAMLPGDDRDTTWLADADALLPLIEADRERAKAEGGVVSRRLAVAQQEAEGIGSLLGLVANDLRLHAEEWPLARQFARRLDALGARAAALRGSP